MSDGTIRLATVARLDVGPRGTFARDILWKNPPPLDPDCDHDFRLLPVIEFRHTILCRKCDGLNISLSHALAAAPSAFAIGENGRITRKISPDGCGEAAQRLRAMNMPEDIISEILGSEAVQEP